MFIQCAFSLAVARVDRGSPLALSSLEDGYTDAVAPTQFTATSQSWFSIDFLENDTIFLGFENLNTKEIMVFEFSWLQTMQGLLQRMELIKTDTGGISTSIYTKIEITGKSNWWQLLVYLLLTIIATYFL